jgi:hypothetical protein
MTDTVKDRIRRPKADAVSKHGRPQREGVALVLKELGFYEHLPRIRRDSREYLRECRRRLSKDRPAPKMTRDVALAQRDKFRSHGRGEWIEPSKFIQTTLSPQLQPTGAAVPMQDPVQYGSVWVNGDGTGFDLSSALQLGFLLTPALFVTDLSGNPTSNYFEATWAFGYTPPEDGVYRFTAGLVGWGKYTLISDDGPFDSHEVYADLVGRLVEIETSTGTGSRLFERTGANINETDTFVGSDTLQIDVHATAGNELTIRAGFDANVWARGDDTFAELDMTQAVGGLLCSGLSMEQIA